VIARGAEGVTQGDVGLPGDAVEQGAGLGVEEVQVGERVRDHRTAILPRGLEALARLVLAEVLVVGRVVSGDDRFEVEVMAVVPERLAERVARLEPIVQGK